MARFLARSVSAAKWKSRANIGPNEVPADGVGADLRSFDNALSFWLCDPEEQRSLEDVVLVLASTRDQVQRLDLVWLSADEVAGMRIGLQATPGATPVSSLNHKHMDLTGIDLSRLFLLAGSVAQSVEGDRIRRFTEKQVLDILANAVRKDVVPAKSLKPSVIAKIQKGSPPPT
jgi:hypothetical protein